MSHGPAKQQSASTSPKAATGGASDSPQKSPGPATGSPKSPSKSLNSPGNPATPATEGLLPGSHWTAAPLEFDDPTLDEEESSAASISSSILQYRSIQGRTYHSDRTGAEYWGANDDRQIEALDIVHHVHTLAIDGKLFLSPVKDDIQKVVDIGTGTGIWAIDFGDSFPSCEVIGTDISPIQPTWVPPNVKFQIDDCCQTWTFPEDSIDFVHMRYLIGSIPDWNFLFEQAFRCTKPGGYVESFEGEPRYKSDDGTVSEDSALAQWGKLFVEGGKILGRTVTMVDDGTQKAAMEHAGFVDIQEHVVKIPVGTWPKDPKLKQLGQYANVAISSDVEGYVTYMANLQGWTKEEIAVYAAHLRREIRNPAIHGYYVVKTVWGRKPGGEGAG